MSYKIKQLPEDFVVEELFVFPKDSGPINFYRMTKRLQNTLEALSLIARELRIPRKYIKYCGNKDKNALTSQIVSIETVSKDIVLGLKLSNISLEHVGSFCEPVFIGAHVANKFTITVRNVDHEPKEKKNVPNLFGEQRFGANNAEIGRSLVKKDFKNAVSLLMADGQLEVAEHLSSSPTDFVGALRVLPKSLLKLYIHSYQSCIWNRTVEAYLHANHDSKQLLVPMVGFGTELGPDVLSKIIQQILKDEKVSPHDFIIRQLPDLSEEGGVRELYLRVTDLKIGLLESDELHENKKNCVVSFSLPKGSYATVLIDSLFQS